jgi:hypothetical protein
MELSFRGRKVFLGGFYRQDLTSSFTFDFFDDFFFELFVVFPIMGEAISSSISLDSTGNESFVAVVASFCEEFE